MFRKMKAKNKLKYTQEVNPKAGLLGLFGFLGLTGFIPKIVNATEIITIPTFFFFFGFFGWFGFYYKGKMSGTLIDERFQLNASRASSLAYKISFWFVIGVAILTFAFVNFFTAYDALSILIATIGIAFGLAVFLEQYLLYRYENEE